MSTRHPTIEVTEEIIASACQRDSSHCMIAEAVKKAIPDAQHVSVDLQTIRWSRKATGRRYFALTPRFAQTAILDFDNGVTPEPFSFRMPQPAQTIKSGRRPVSKAKLVSSRTGPAGVPVKKGGVSPPIGPLAGGSLTGEGLRTAKRTGRIRKFGLRGMER